MDALDVRILRRMRLSHFWPGPPQSPDAFKPGTIAKAIGSTPETVKERIKRLEEAGVIKGYPAIPQLTYLGLEVAGYAFHIPDEDAKVRAKERIALVDGVAYILDYFGPVLSLGLTYANAAERDRRLRLLAEQTGDPKPWLAWQLPRLETRRREVSSLDWRLILALRSDATRPLEEVARDVGVTYRTAKRRLDALFRDGVVRRGLSTNPSEVPGLLPVELYVTLHDASPAAMNGVLRAFDDTVVESFAQTGPQGHHLTLWLFASTLAETERLRQRATTLKAVKRARALLRRDITETSDWIDELIAARIKGAA